MPGSSTTRGSLPDARAWHATDRPCAPARAAAAGCERKPRTSRSVRVEGSTGLVVRGGEKLRRSCFRRRRTRSCRAPGSRTPCRRGPPCPLHRPRSSRARASPARRRSNGTRARCARALASGPTRRAAVSGPATSRRARRSTPRWPRCVRSSTPLYLSGQGRRGPPGSCATAAPSQASGHASPTA